MITKLGNPVLRKPATLAKIGNEAQRLASTLFEQAKQHGAWGIAAPQIGQSVQLFIMAKPRLNRRARPLPSLGDRFVIKGMHFGLHYTAIVNPEIVGASEEITTEYEQCLSIPGIAAIVPRHQWIDATFQTLDGKRRKHRLHGHPARVFQHEHDHLNGIVFLDRIFDVKDIVADTELTYSREYSDLDSDVDLDLDSDVALALALDVDKVEGREEVFANRGDHPNLQGLSLTPGSYEQIYIEEDEELPLQMQYA